MNWQMQSHGSEMLRLACCLATEAGLQIAAPVHDALLLVAPADRIEAEVVQLQECMAEASRIVLADKLTIGSEAEIVYSPNRYRDPRGAAMWSTIKRLSEEADPRKPAEVA